MYYNFDRITWTDSTGQQKFRAQVDGNKNVLTNVEERKYFQVIKNGGGYPLPGEPSARFGFEPVNSWTNGEFSIIISKKSQLKQWHIASISTKKEVMQKIAEKENIRMLTGTIYPLS